MTLALIAAWPLAGCGEERPAVIGVVRLELAGPADSTVVRAEEVAVRGTVSPASARVRVDGREVDHDGATFSATVPLREGVNVVDVLADAPRRRPAIAAIRVRRPITVELPQLENESVPAARRRLTALGLRVEVRHVGGVFDDLLPGDPHVCRTEPGGGTRVEVPSTVLVSVGRSC